MGMERRFDDDQVAEILRGAADLQSKAGLHSEHGTTLADLKRIGEEVGFDPELIERAAQDLERRALDLQAEHKGAGTYFEQTVPNAVDDEAWEDILTELRRTSGRSGKTVTRGLTREWLGGSDAMSITFSARQRDDSTRLRLLLDVGNLRASLAVGLPFGLMATVMTGALSHKAGLETTLAILVGLAVGAAAVLAVRWAVASWMRSTRQRVSELFRRIIERASLPSSSMLEVPSLAEAENRNQETQEHRA